MDNKAEAHKNRTEKIVASIIEAAERDCLECATPAALVGARKRVRILEAENRNLAARLQEAEKIVGEFGDALAAAQEEITDLNEALAIEKRKTFRDMDSVEQVAFLQKHFGSDWAYRL